MTRFEVADDGSSYGEAADRDGSDRDRPGGKSPGGKIAAAS